MATSRKLSFSCRPEHWKTTKFADNKTLIKAEKYFHSFNVVHLNFVSIFCCYKFHMTTLRWVTHCCHLNHNFKHLFRFCSEELSLHKSGQSSNRRIVLSKICITMSSRNSDLVVLITYVSYSLTRVTVL